MSKFIFIVAETFHSKFEVEALDPENAIESFLEGDGVYLEKSSDHYGTNENEGYKGILEMIDKTTQEVFDPQLIEELAFRKTYKGERLYTLEEAKALLETTNIESTADVTLPVPISMPALKSE